MSSKKLPEPLPKKIGSQTNEKIINALYDNFSGRGEKEAFVITGNVDPFISGQNKNAAGQNRVYFGSFRKTVDNVNMPRYNKFTM